MNALPPEADSDALQLGRLIEQAMDNRRAGLPIDVEALLEEKPRYAEQLAELLPVLEVLADLSEVSSRSPSDEGVASGSDTASDDSPTISIIGDYQILRELGRGGMGVVYEARQINLGRRVAIKILPFAALLNEIQLTRFNTEATAAARLQHAGIVQVYSVGCERGIHFYAMQLIDGPSLAEVIAEMRQEEISVDPGEAAETVVVRRADALTRDQDGGHYRAVARIGKEAAEALQYAHDNGVLHRDIKPSNLLLNKSGHVLIADFGLARVEDESQLTRTGEILGTLRYMSPEQAVGERVDARTDVFSLGATLYELATLQPAFGSNGRRDIIQQITAGNPLAPHIVDACIPQPLSHVINKAMAPLDERYQSAQELAGDLQRFLDGSPVTATPPTPLRRTTAWLRRNRLASAAMVGLLTLVFVSPFTTHHFFQSAPDGSLTKGHDMKVSQKAKVAVAAAAIAMATTAVQAKKPAKPDPGPTLPPVRYEIRYFEIEPEAFIDIWAANNSAQVVGLYIVEGQRRAFLYDYVTDPMTGSVGQAIDLNTLTFDTGYGVPEGWAIRNALDINDAGDIVGNLVDVATDVKIGYVLDMNRTDGNGNPLLPRLYAIPGEENILSTMKSTKSINNNGDVLGLYDTGAGFGYYLINFGLDDESTAYPMIDLGQTFSIYGYNGKISDVIYDGSESLGPLFVVSSPEFGVLQQYPWSGESAVNAGDSFITVLDINSYGTFAGDGNFEVPLNRNKTKTEYLPYLSRLDGTVVTFGVEDDRVRTINDNDDVLMMGNSLYHSALNATCGLLSLNDLVQDVNDPVTLELWNDSEGFCVTNRSFAVDPENVVAADLPQIAGRARDRGFVLTPVAYQQ